MQNQISVVGLLTLHTGLLVLTYRSPHTGIQVYSHCRTGLRILGYWSAHTGIQVYSYWHAGLLILPCRSTHTGILVYSYWQSAHAPQSNTQGSRRRYTKIRTQHNATVHDSTDEMHLCPNQLQQFGQGLLLAQLKHLMH